MLIGKVSLSLCSDDLGSPVITVGKKLSMHRKTHLLDTLPLTLILNFREPNQPSHTDRNIDMNWNEVCMHNTRQMFVHSYPTNPSHHNSMWQTPAKAWLCLGCAPSHWRKLLVASCGKLKRIKIFKWQDTCLKLHRELVLSSHKLPGFFFKYPLKTQVVLNIFQKQTSFIHRRTEGAFFFKTTIMQECQRTRSYHRVRPPSHYNSAAG